MTYPTFPAAIKAAEALRIELTNKTVKLLTPEKKEISWVGINWGVVDGAFDHLHIRAVSEEHPLKSKGPFILAVEHYPEGCLKNNTPPTVEVIGDAITS